jgi:hypothetical protein
MTPPKPNERLVSGGDTTVGIYYLTLAASVAVTLTVGVLAWIPGALDRYLTTQPGWLKALPLLAIVVGSAGWIYMKNLCTVYLTPNGLRITRGKTEILVPMDQIKEVTRSPRGRADDARAIRGRGAAAPGWIPILRRIVE